jgi:hypothetical protein
MRWFILSVVGTFVAGIAANPADAQSFRRAPIRPTPMMTAPRSFVPFNPSFVTPRPTVTHSTMGTFNPATGRFMPSLVGPFTLSQRNGFQPVTGTFMPSATGSFSLQTRQAFNPNTGTFVPSTTGNFVARERGNFTPASGAFTNASSGTFNPQTGRFMPNTAGLFSLTSRASFVPSNGFFVPSRSGSFVLSAHEAFRPGTNSFVPAANGSFLFQTRGNFITANAAAALTSPVTVGSTGVFTNTSFPSLRQNQSLFTQTTSPFGFNNGFSPFGFNNGFNSFGFNNGFNPFFGNQTRAFNNGFNLNPNIPSVAENRRFVALSSSFAASQGLNPFGFNNSFAFNNPFTPFNPFALNNPFVANSARAFNSGFVLNPNIPSVRENQRFLAQANAFVATQGVNPFGFNNSFAFTNPFLSNRALAFNNPLLANQLGLWSPWQTNPNLWSPYGAGFLPTAAGWGGASYAAPYSSSYPPQSYAAPSYASNNASLASYASNSNIPAYTPPADQTKQQPVLGAYGSPNENGSVKWPLAFRRMTANEKQELLDPLESRLQVLTTQATAGNINPDILRLAKQNTTDLRRWLSNRRTDLPTDTLADTTEFLLTLDKGLSSMRRAF